MDITKELDVIGIIPGEQLSIDEKHYVAKSITEKLTNNIHQLAENYNELYMRIFNCEMYYAQVDEKFKGVFYYYKNNRIYIDKNACNIEEYLVHEIIHYLQSFNKIDKQQKRAGLCQFLEFSLCGLGINEAIVQYITAKALGNKLHRINSKLVSICTNSESYYKYMTSLACQILFLIGEDQAVKSCISSTEGFENQLYNSFEENTEKILKAFDSILEENDNINRDENKIIEIYMQTQEIIYKTYFSKIYKRLNCINEIDKEVEKLEEYEKIMGKILWSVNNQDDFNIFKDEMNNKFTKRYIELNKKQTKNSLVVIYRNVIYNFFTKLSTIIQKKIIRNKMD